MRAVVLVGGPSPGLVALAEGAPAALLPVLDRPAAGHCLDRLRDCGLDDVALDAGTFADAADAALGEHAALRPAALVRSGEPAPAVALRPAAPDEPVLLVRGDVLVAADLAAFADAYAGRGATVARHGAIDVATVLGPDALAALGDRPLGDAADSLRGLGFTVNEVALAGPVYVLDAITRLRDANFAALRGEFGVRLRGTELDKGLTVGERTSLDGVAMIDPPAWIGADVEIGVNARLHGPVVIGAGATIGDGALLCEAVVLAGATLPRETVLAGGIAGHAGSVVASAGDRSPYDAA